MSGALLTSFANYPRSVSVYQSGKVSFYKRTLIIDVSPGINCAYGYNVVKMGVESSILDLRPGSSSLICLSWSVFDFFCNLSISSCLQRDIYGTKMTPIQNVSQWKS